MGKQILTSYAEEVPNVTPEAMASGLPMVLSDIEGTRDVADSHENTFEEYLLMEDVCLC